MPVRFATRLLCATVKGFPLYISAIAASALVFVGSSSAAMTLCKRVFFWAQFIDKSLSAKIVAVRAISGKSPPFPKILYLSGSVQ